MQEKGENSKIKILLFLNPLWFIYESDTGIDVLNSHLFYLLTNNLDVNKIEYKAFFHEIAYQNRNKLLFNEYTEVKYVSNKEIRNIFPQNLAFTDIHNKELSINGLTKTEIENIKKLYLSKFENWEPDIIYSIGCTPPYLQEIFPNSLILTQENAIFSSRFPFMRTIFNDPLGFGRFDFLHKYKNEIWNFQISEDNNKKIEKLKKTVISIIDEFNPIKQKILTFKKKFNKLILVPLSSGCNHIGAECDFKSEYEYLDYIFENIPQNYGVIVTQHDNGAKVLSKPMIEYFNKKYTNFIYMNDIHKSFGSASLYYFQYVDVILNLFSTTGLQAALFWDKPVIAMDKFYTTWYAAGNNLKDIDNPIKVPTNNILYWYFTHYTLFDFQLINKEWLFNYYTNKLEKFKNNKITFDYFNQNSNIDKISKYIINYVKNNYLRNENTAHKMSFRQKLFSKIKDNKRIKIIIFGIKFSFKLR